MTTAMLETNTRGAPNLEFDATSGRITDGAIRYLLIRADGLMQAFAQLPDLLRPAAFATFAASIRQHGGHSLRRYQSQQPLASAELLDLVSTASGHLGWGHWSFETNATTGLSLTVRHSPFAAGYGRAEQPVCFPIVGMLSALGDIVLGAPSLVTETQCCACGAELCTFTVRLRRPEDDAMPD